MHKLINNYFTVILHYEFLLFPDFVCFFIIIKQTRLEINKDIHNSFYSSLHIKMYIKQKF